MAACVPGMGGMEDMEDIGRVCGVYMCESMILGSELRCLGIIHIRDE